MHLPRKTGSLARMTWRDRIAVDPAIRGGKPCIKGTRIVVSDLLEYLAGGMSDDEILRDFPDLTRDAFALRESLPRPAVPKPTDRDSEFQSGWGGALAVR